FGTNTGCFTDAFTASLLAGNGYGSRATINKDTESVQNNGMTGGFTETGHTWNIGDAVTLYMQAVIDNDTVEYYVSNTGFNSLTKVIQINLRTYFQNVPTTGPDNETTWEGASKNRFPAETGLMKVGVYKFGDGGNAATFSEISVKYEGYHTDKTAVAAKEATCTEEGNIAHQTCDICGEHFDMQGNPVSAESVIIAKTPLTKVEAVEATCAHAGNKAYYKCDDCGKCFSDSNGNTQIEASSVILPALPHAMRKLDAQQSTCKTAGNIEYYHCEDCDKYYSDQSGTNEITLQEATLPLAAHTLEKIEGTSSTKEEAGNIEYYKCSECGKYFRDAEGKTEITLAQTVTPKKVSGCHSALGSVTGVGMAIAALAACVCVVTFRKKRSA
ncbi:MAG: hypothetical protein K2L51_07085, partial [Clostridiales bacterium]|nr:hypothetical protein [Clostridiales bacterium]